MVTKTRVSRKQKVYNALKEARSGTMHVGNLTVTTANGWVNGEYLLDSAIGGEGGLRRLRELRDEGYRILMRRSKDTGTFQYRLDRVKRVF